jgi:hypothetical protein
VTLPKGSLDQRADDRGFVHAFVEKKFLSSDARIALTNNGGISERA